jgi:hypothetical protein
MASGMEGNDVLAELKEQTRWLRFLGLRELRPALLSALGSEAERRAYELTDGTRSTRAVADAAGVSQKTISNWWQRWASAGIVTTDANGRATQLAPLRSAGIEMGSKLEREVSESDG